MLFIYKESQLEPSVRNGSESEHELLLNLRIKKSKEDIALFISYRDIHRSTLKCVVATSLILLLAMSTKTILPKINFTISVMKSRAISR